MKTIFRASRLMLFASAMLIAFTFNASAQSDDPYKEGSVWNVTYVKTHANMGDDYLKQISNTWAMAMEAFVEAGFVKSYKIFTGQAFGDDDFNIMLMMEFENFASMDPNPDREAKMKQIEEELKAKMGDEKYEKTVGNYDNIRDILGSKTFRELHLK